MIRSYYKFIYTSNYIPCLIAILVIVFYFGKNLRFLAQGRWYRRLDDEKQRDLTQADPLWHWYHGKSIPRVQLIPGIQTVMAVWLWLIGRDSDLF